MNEKQWEGNSDGIEKGEALEHRAKWCEGATNHLKFLREKQS